MTGYRSYEVQRSGAWRIAFRQVSYFELYCSVCWDRYVDENALGRDLFDTVTDAIRAATEDGWTVSAAPIVEGPAIHATYAVCERTDERHRNARNALMPPMPDLEFGLDGQDPLPGMGAELDRRHAATTEPTQEPS